MASRYITVAEAAFLTGITERGIRQRIQRSGAAMAAAEDAGECGDAGAYNARQMDKEAGRARAAYTHGRGGNGGRKLLIDIDTLPLTAKTRRYLLEHPGRTGEECNLAGYKARFGEEGLKAFEERLTAVIETLMQCERGKGKTEAVRKAAESLGVSQRRMYELMARYRENGAAGLLDRVERKDAGQPRKMCRMAMDMIHAEYMSANKLTQNVVYDNVRRIAEALGDRACDICPYNPASLYHAQEVQAGHMRNDDVCPQMDRALRDGNAPMPEGIVAPAHRSTVNRYIASIPPAVRDAGRMGMRYWEAKYMPKCIRRKPEMVNEVWFGDHHVFDCFVLDDAGRPVWPWLSAFSDARSGAIVGWHLSVNPNSHTVMESLTSGVGRTAGSDFYGAPLMIYIDNGKDYRCRRIEGDGLRDYAVGKLNLDCTGDNALLKTLGIGVTHAIPYRAWSKTIERIFGIIEKRWGRSIPGWCGNGIDAKPVTLMHDLREKRLWTFREFSAYFANVILPEYHSTRFEGGKTPMEIYNESEKARGEETVSWAVLSMSKMMRTARAVTGSGIKFFGRLMQHPALDEVVGQTVDVLYNDKGDDSVTVMQGSRYICEAYEAQTYALVGESEERLSEHMERQGARRRETRAALRVPRERISVIGMAAAELPDMQMSSSITTMTQERAFRGRTEAKERIRAAKEGGTAAQKSASDRIRAQLAAKGAALLALSEEDD